MGRRAPRRAPRLSGYTAPRRGPSHPLSTSVGPVTAPVPEETLDRAAPGPAAGLELLHICTVELSKAAAEEGDEGQPHWRHREAQELLSRTQVGKRGEEGCPPEAALRPEINAALAMLRGRSWLIFSRLKTKQGDVGTWTGA